MFTLFPPFSKKIAFLFCSFWTISAFLQTKNSPFFYYLKQFILSFIEKILSFFLSKLFFLPNFFLSPRLTLCIFFKEKVKIWKYLLCTAIHSIVDCDYIPFCDDPTLPHFNNYKMNKSIFPFSFWLYRLFHIYCPLGICNFGYLQLFIGFGTDTAG